VGNVETVKGIYEMLERGNIPGVLESFSSDAEWRLAEGHPYAPDGRPLFGPEAIGAEFFARAGEEWDGFAISPEQIHDAGDVVVVECRYAGLYTPTGKTQRTQVCHIWKARDGKVTRFQQYADTAHLREVMGR
jgi:uncharacterized protein